MKSILSIIPLITMLSMISCTVKTEEITLTTRSVIIEPYDYEYKEYTIPKDELALIVIDAVQGEIDNKNNSRIENNVNTKLAELLQVARDNGILVIHSPNGGIFYDVAKPLEGEFITNDAKKLKRYLRRHHIEYLLYAGYATNRCLLARDTGLLNNPGYCYPILVRDCTVAIGDGCLTGATIDLIEWLWADSTTVDDLKRALKP